jgi:hypothetical protein
MLIGHLQPPRWVHGALLMAFSVAVGAHSVILQIGAWSGMILVRSQTMPVSEAVATTFDGQHPCCVCKAIQQDQAPPAEEMAAWTMPERLQMLIPATWNPARLQIFSPAPGWIPPGHAPDLRAPPVPPPRSLAAV